MSKYLVVTHRTALSPDLQHKVSALVAEDGARSSPCSSRKRPAR